MATKVYNACELGDFATAITTDIPADISSRIGEEIERSDVTGPDLATEVSWNSKGVTMNAGHDVTEPVKAEPDRVVQKVLGGFGTPTNSP